MPLYRVIYGDILSFREKKGRCSRYIWRIAEIIIDSTARALFLLVIRIRRRRWWWRRRRTRVLSVPVRFFVVVVISTVGAVTFSGCSLGVTFPGTPALHVAVLRTSFHVSCIPRTVCLGEVINLVAIHSTDFYPPPWWPTIRIIDWGSYQEQTW